MNGLPGIDPQAAERAERTMQAREQVKLWTNALKSQHLSACMFSMQGPMADSFQLFLGAVDHELREQGYEIVSHSHTPIGRNGNVVMLSYTFLVRARGEHAPRVMLA